MLIAFSCGYIESKPPSSNKQTRVLLVEEMKYFCFLCCFVFLSSSRTQTYQPYRRIPCARSHSINSRVQLSSWLAAHFCLALPPIPYTFLCQTHLQLRKILRLRQNVLVQNKNIKGQLNCLFYDCWCFIWHFLFICYVESSTSRQFSCFRPPCHIKK